MHKRGSPTRRFRTAIAERTLDHVVVFDEAHPRRILAAYAGYDDEARTHLALAKDTPSRRSIQHLGQIVAWSIHGGPHYQYCRIWFSAGTMVILKHERRRLERSIDVDAA
jgi:hypothetical protein